MKIKVYIELEELIDFIEGSNVSTWLSTKQYTEERNRFRQTPEELYGVEVDSSEVMVVRDNGRVMIEGSNCRERRLEEEMEETSLLKERPEYPFD